MVQYEDLEKGKEKILIIGLGYVGLPLAVAMAKYFNIVGFDRNSQRIKDLKKGLDSTGEVTKAELLNSNIEFQDRLSDKNKFKFIIVAVPTPVDKLKNPDLSFLVSASEVVGRHISKGGVAVFESTVYPGATEEVCVPVIEKESGLRWKRDFWIGYSPERVNPGDREHNIERVVKIVSGDTPQTLELVASVYGKVIKAGVYKSPDIKTAEAAKVIENIQRDINIALMNELALIFHKLGLDTKEVLNAAKTKWNFLPFEPGLVGGHCIPVDPYYLARKSVEVGHAPELILAGRGVNEFIPLYIAHEIVKILIKAGKKVKGSKILILGATFKENVPDLRNSKVMELSKELEDFGMQIYHYDPVVMKNDLNHEYRWNFIDDINHHSPYDCVVLAVKHEVFIKKFSLDFYSKIMKTPCILIDIKGAYDREEILRKGFLYWRL
ncbi:nucleotide sugar dehydrogenase [Thermodesulfovibrio yellowstonii]|uniref:VI polysaccharide biosynthesis protein VipA/tviB n=1 Tax=Thermodesulfovibrio yellowstonii (strain ATCC 51303 / DSM 11347 / YP87) TaxID=289376 RepID=B5YJ56_THEYD|nr:nucleotide sugar dehydrogenase [Thermodesulfovibrio yellowstonii]ACI20457.1 VI polysaccharide biosynthesis protein VipA/tviB [Thermodesulfovibrio yellowstonii DSM 11347]